MFCCHLNFLLNLRCLIHNFFITQVNDEYLRTLEILSKKLKHTEVDHMAKTSKALKDVQPELEKLRQKAVSKVVILSYKCIDI